MAKVSHKLKNSFDGALAGGGDPASSPLYVFGPFLQMVTAGGVAYITFGASIWLVVLTVITVSAVYKSVMRWIIDGSGGSGLCEEEFGPWAVKINAGVTVLEYTLTFLVSIAALVSFVSDRFYQHLSVEDTVIPIRLSLAILVSILVCMGVNLGPRLAAKIFGPATLGIMILLWVMMGASIWHFGLHLPSLHLNAFHWDNIHYTLGGYARILALMTGIEIFANLVPAYQGTAQERSRKAFGALLIIMGTTCLTMLILGPVILQVSDPMNENVSVFTQTMDRLLPGPLAYFGTIVAVVVLLSAAAASAQGIQNLALGLRYRHYIPAAICSLNRFHVANKPVWVMTIVCIFCYVFIGTTEETYLALYAAGVFILLSLTSWACVKRLYTRVRTKNSVQVQFSFFGSIIAAVLTTLAALIIFEERFFDGAWFYIVLTPLLYFIFSHYREKLGKPRSISERMGTAISTNSLSQFNYLPVYQTGISFDNILVPLDTSPESEYSLACAQTIARNSNGTIHLLTVLSDEHHISNHESEKCLSLTDTASAHEYLNDIKADLVDENYKITIDVKVGSPPDVIAETAEQSMDLIIMSMHHDSSIIDKWLSDSRTLNVIKQTTPPLLVLRPTSEWRSIRTRFKRILVALDASESSEQIIPFTQNIASRFMSKVILLSVSEASDNDKLVKQVESYVKNIATGFQQVGLDVETKVLADAPAQTIINVSQEMHCDLIIMATHGRGGLERQEYVKTGSVTKSVLQNTPCPLLLISARS